MFGCRADVDDQEPVVSAVDNQDLPDRSYHLDRMLKASRATAATSAGAVPASTPGIGEDQLLEGARRSTMEELADWPLEADRIVVRADRGPPVLTTEAGHEASEKFITVELTGAEGATAGFAEGRLR